MAIHLYGSGTTDSTRQVDNNSVAKATSANSQTAATKAATEDTTAFSSDKTSVQSLTQTALQPFPSRQVRVEALKQAVNSAEYQLDADKIAQSLANSDI